MSWKWNCDVIRRKFVTKIISIVIKDIANNNKIFHYENFQKFLSFSRPFFYVKKLSTNKVDCILNFDGKAYRYTYIIYARSFNPPPHQFGWKGPTQIVCIKNVKKPLIIFKIQGVTENFIKMSYTREETEWGSIENCATQSYYFQIENTHFVFVHICQINNDCQYFICHH